MEHRNNNNDSSLMTKHARVSCLCFFIKFIYNLLLISPVSFNNQVDYFFNKWMLPLRPRDIYIYIDPSNYQTTAMLHLY